MDLQRQCLKLSYEDIQHCARDILSSKLSESVTQLHLIPPYSLGTYSDGNRCWLLYEYKGKANEMSFPG